MDKEMKCVVAEQVCEFVMGSALGICLNKTVASKCEPLEKIVVSLGGGLAGWLIGRAFQKEFYKFCDHTFDTDIAKYLNE